jgi:hypothetical protein
MTFTLSTVTVTAPPIPYPPYVPKLPTPRLGLSNIQATSDQFTNLKLLYKSVKTLDEQIEPMEKNIDFILSQLSPEEQTLLSGDFEALRQQGINAKANADRKFNEQVSLLKLWHVYDNPKYPTEIQKLAVLGYVLSRMHSDAARQNWENEYGVARLQEIEIKKKLVDAYRQLMPALNEAYLHKFYPDYERFPEISRENAIVVIGKIGALNFYEGFLDNKVEILISDSLLTKMGSQFGHVAINIGGVIYGRAPTAWSIRGKEEYLSKQETMRSTIGYVIQLDDAEKQKLFQSVINKIVQDEKYSLVDHSCSGEIISSFAELGPCLLILSGQFGRRYQPV